MLFSLTIKDTVSYIRKSPLSFLFFFAGLFTVSLISIMVLSLLRYNFINGSTSYFDCKYTVIYNKAVSAEEVVSALGRDYSALELTLFNGTAYENSKSELSEYMEGIHNSSRSDTTDMSALGIAGYSKSKHNIYKTLLSSGRFFNRGDSGESRALISRFMGSYTDGNVITACGNTFSVIGTVEDSWPLFTDNNVFTDIKSFVNTGEDVKAIFIRFYLPPTASYFRNISAALEGLGENENNAGLIKTFGFGTVINFLLNCAALIAVTGILLLSVTLLYKCWLKSQQYVYTVYSLCGMRDRTAAFLRYTQALFFTAAAFASAVLVNLLMITLNYKKYLCEPDILLTFLDFLLIVAVSMVLVYKQNKNNSAFKAIEGI